MNDTFIGFLPVLYSAGLIDFEQVSLWTGVERALFTSSFFLDQVQSGANTPYSVRLFVMWNPTLKINNDFQTSWKYASLRPVRVSSRKLRVCLNVSAT